MFVKMKTVFGIALVWAMGSTALLGQEQYLLQGPVFHGGFGGPEVRLGQAGGESAHFMGGKGGWIINHSFYLGGAGYGLVNDLKIMPDADEKLSIGYGGLELGIILGSDNLVHLSASTLLGAGGVNYRYNHFEADFSTMVDNPVDVFYVIEPSVHLMVNITSFFRLGVGASYRQVYDLDFEGYESADLTGPSASLLFKFGKF